MASIEKKIDIDAILLNLLVVLLIAISLISIILVKEFVGQVSFHAAKGGEITEINVYDITPANRWNGVFGITIQVKGLNSSWFIFANEASMSEINPLFDCLQKGITHEVYATTLNSSLIDWNAVTAGTTAQVDSFINTSLNDTMSATKTFTLNITVEIGSNIITNVPATYMYQYSTPGSTAFPVGILNYNGTIIMVAIINENIPVGFRPDKQFNFEMMVPVPKDTSNLRYNLYVDPFDTCPEGEEGNFSDPGSVYGWVVDNSTGAFLSNVLVAIEKKIYITGVDGFYNITGLQPGKYYIVGLLSGYNNYVNNVTIISLNETLHNITMVQSPNETLTGTGPGVGTGVGPGEGPGQGPGDDPPGTKTQSGEGPGVGPGVGPGIGPYIEKPEEFGIDHFISLDRLKKTLRLDTFFTEHLLIFNFRKETVNIQVKVTGNASRILELSDSLATIEQNKYANITVRGFGLEKGLFTGNIEVSGDFNDSLPVEILVTDEDKLPVEALLVELDVLTRRPLPGSSFRFRVGLQNLLIEESFDVRLDYFLRGIETDTANRTMYIGNDTLSLLTAESIIKETIIPSDWPKGDYLLIVETNYLNLYSRTSTVFELFEPLYRVKILGIELWKLLAALTFLATIIGIILYFRHRANAQKRFHAKVEYKLLPQKGPRSLYVGKIAETEIDTYFDMDKLTVHSIIAGSTGGGKSISAQVIVEEALLKGVAVIVFDPTAQWSGMLRKCVDEKMLLFYPRFHMTKKDARAFNGNIMAIKNAREKIELAKYWKPGEIQVFTTSTLDPKDMDVFVANTVREVFHSNLQEYRGLRFMMVYDEVHRLLPKFGGSGEGFIQIERACREFRKWGIGVMLVSQVLADFVGQIKANINTEIQMKTRDEGDLERIKTKYGGSFIQELVKSPVGSGMVQNSDWNRGKPYYITFRPILHSVVRLTDEELEKYNKYNEIVEDLSFQLDQLEKEGKDVFDLRLELKLSLDKIKQGGFNMVEIYLEGLKPRIDKIWKDLGKKPKKRQVELISDEEIKSAIQAAQKESEKAKAQESSSKGTEEVKKLLGMNDDVPPNKMLKLVNGTLVVKLNALVDEIKVLKDNEFSQHVNEDKNEFAKWIRDAYGNDKWADISDQIIAKDDYIKFLELLSQNKEKTFKPLTARAKPFSSKPGAPKQEAKKPEENKAEKSAPPQGQTAAEQKQKTEDKTIAQPSQTTQPEPAKTQAEPQKPQVSEPIQKDAKEDASKNDVIKKSESIKETKPEQKPSIEPAKTEPANQAQTQEQPAQAIQEGEQIPNWQEINAKLATFKTSQEKTNYMLSILQKYPTDTNLFFSIAAEYHRTADLVNAETYYKKILQKTPNNTKVLYYLGTLYNTQKKYTEALDLFKKVKTIQPNYPKVDQYISSIESQLSMVKKA